MKNRKKILTEQSEMFPRSFSEMENVIVKVRDHRTQETLVISGYVVFQVRGEPGKYYVHAQWSADAPPYTRKVGWESMVRAER